MKWWSWLSSVRSVVALAIAGTFCYLAVLGTIPPDKFQDVVILVFTFYFLKQRSTESQNGGTK